MVLFNDRYLKKQGHAAESDDEEMELKGESDECDDDALEESMMMDTVQMNLMMMH